MCVSLYIYTYVEFTTQFSYINSIFTDKFLLQISMNALIMMADVPISVSIQKVVIIVSVLLDTLYIIIIITVKVGYIYVAMCDSVYM